MLKRFSMHETLCTRNIERDTLHIRSKFKCEDQKVNLFKDLPKSVYNLYFFCEARELLY